MAVTIEDRLTPAMLEKLGAMYYGGIITISEAAPRIREVYFEFGWFREVDDEAWFVSEATTADRFVPPSA